MGRDKESRVFPFPVGRLDSLPGVIQSVRKTLSHSPAPITLSEEDPDWQAVLDEHYFAKRFGFDACKAFRKQVIVLKNGADLTDREIRTLRRSGNLQFKSGNLAVLSSRIEQMWGWILIGAIANLMLLGVLAASKTPHPTFQQVAVVVGLEALCVALWWWTMEIYVRPTTIAKRIPPNWSDDPPGEPQN